MNKTKKVLGVMPGSRYFNVGDQYYCTSAFHAQMWKECLQVFDEVIVMDRVSVCDKVEPAYKPVLIDNVRFIDFPNFFGHGQLVCRLPKMFCVARRAAKQADIWHFSAGSIPSFCLWFWLFIYRVPYSIELRGEQAMNVDYLKMRGTHFPWLIVAVEKLILWLQRSKAVACVGVAKFLSETYGPLDKSAPRLAISDSRMPLEIYKKPRIWEKDSHCRIIVTLGRVEAQKNPVGMMKMLAELDKKGFTNWRFKWIGNGPLMDKAKELAVEFGIEDRVDFLGLVPWQDVFETLNKSDLFVLNSMSEGMPRALLEAMATGLPAISVNICGMPEILLQSDLVPKDDHRQLADKIYEVLSDPARMCEMSKRNIETAKNYSAEVLSKRKLDFYKWLRKYIENNKIDDYGS